MTDEKVIQLSSIKHKPCNCFDKNRSSNSSGKWEEQFAEYEAHVGMPAESTPLYNWKNHQMSN